MCSFVAFSNVNLGYLVKLIDRDILGHGHGHGIFILATHPEGT